MFNLLYVIRINVFLYSECSFYRGDNGKPYLGAKIILQQNLLKNYIKQSWSCCKVENIRISKQQLLQKTKYISIYFIKKKFGHNRVTSSDREWGKRQRKKYRFFTKLPQTKIFWASVFFFAKQVEIRKSGGSLLCIMMWLRNCCSR